MRRPLLTASPTAVGAFFLVLLLPLLAGALACGTSDSTREANEKIRELEARIASSETLLAAEASERPTRPQQVEAEGIIRQLSALIEGLGLEPELRPHDLQQRETGNSEEIIHRLDLIIEGLELDPDLRPQDLEPHGEAEEIFWRLDLIIEEIGILHETLGAPVFELHAVMEEVVHRLDLIIESLELHPKFGLHEPEAHPDTEAIIHRLDVVIEDLGTVHEILAPPPAVRDAGAEDIIQRLDEVIEALEAQLAAPETTGAGNP